MGSTIDFNAKKWNGAFSRTKHSDHEKNSGERLLEPGEYVSTKTLVERMMNQGVRNQVIRAMEHLYEYGPDEAIPDDLVVVHGRRDFDIIDAHNLSRFLESKIRHEEYVKDETKKPQTEPIEVDIDKDGVVTPDVKPGDSGPVD